MKYDNSHVRRQDRILDEQRAVALLRSAEWGFLSMVSPEGGGYGVPINFVWDGDSRIYLHCGRVGRKLEALKLNPDVTFCVVDGVQVLPERLATAYESIILTCHATLEVDDDEKRHALTLMIKKLAPEYLEEGSKYIEKSFRYVRVVRLDVSSWSGKARKPW